MDHKLPTTNNLFADVKFVIAECQNADNIKNLLIDNGAKHINYLSEHVTLVISDVTCLEADEAMNIFEKPIVSSIWVHLSLKAKKLLPLEAYCPYRNIFQNVIATFSSELTQKDINVLACTLTYHGARVSKNITSCTHFIVPNLNTKDFPSESADIKPVAPDWVLESIRQNTRCNEELFEPSLLLPPPPPRPSTPPPAPPQNMEPPKRNVPSDSTPGANSDYIAQSRPEQLGNSQQKQLQVQTGVRQPYLPQQAQVHQVAPHPQRSSQHQQQIVNPDIVQPELQSHANEPHPSHLPQTRPMLSPQRLHQPQMQSPTQVTTRIQPQPRMRMQSPHIQQHQLHHQPQPQHPNHQSNHMNHQPQPQLHQHHPHQQQHYQHTLQHPQHQQQHVVTSNQTLVPVRAQPQPVGPRVLRPQTTSTTQLIDPKQNNMRPMHSPQMTNMRHQLPDQTSFDNFNQSNHRRPEYVSTPPQYQPHPRVRQPYSPMPQQTQMHQIQSPVHQTPPPPQQHHVSPDRIQTEFQPQPNLQQPTNMLPQPRPISNMQHHSHPQMQSQSQILLNQPVQVQNTQNQHQLSHHPPQTAMQMRPQSQVGIPQQAMRPQHHPAGNQIDQRQNNMTFIHPQPIASIRHPQPDMKVSHDTFNQSKFAGDPSQYEQHQRPPQTYQYSPQQAQTHRIQSPVHHPIQSQPHQHVSPDRIQPDVPPHPTMQLQSQHSSQNQSHQMQHVPTAQGPIHIRPQLQPGTSNQNIRPQSFGQPNQIDQRHGNMRPMPSPQLSHIQMSNPRLAPADDSGHPQPHPSIFDHSLESNLAQIKSKVPVLKESVQYFGHGPSQDVPKNQPLFGCKFKLVGYKGVDPKTRDEWCRAVMDAGGAYCDVLNEATHLVCESRKSTEYSQAVSLGIRCITINWIKDIILLNRLTHPWKALHLPHTHAVGENPLNEEIVAVTNFKGRDRREIKDMIEKTGAKFTEYFSAKNTLIICGSAGGEKYDRAIEWKIPLANCQLLSDILLFGCENLDQLLAQSKYKNFGRKDPFKIASFHPKIREFLQPWTRPIPLVELKVPIEAQSNVNGNASDLNSAESKEQTHLDETVQDTETKLDVKTNGTDPKVILKSEVVQPCENDHREHEKPNLSEVGELVPIIDQNEVIEGIKQTRDIEVADSQKSDEKENALAPSKRARKSQEPIRLLHTNVRSDSIVLIQEAATKLGLSFASNPKDCTHLLVDHLCRTKKFICAFSHARYILNPSWLLESSSAGEVLDERPFIVQDREGEERYSFNLIHSLVKRKRRSELIFNKWVFFLTPSMKKHMPDLESIIESAGGSVYTKKLPTKKQIEQLKSDGKRIVVVTSDEDYYLCSSVESDGAEVVSPEFVISGILRQDIDLEVHRVRKKPRLDYT